MGRSVMTLSGAEAIAYSTFEPDASFYSDLYDDDKADGLIEQDADFDDYMASKWEDDAAGVWAEEIDNVAEAIFTTWPSLKNVVAEDEWIGSELRVIARNKHSIVTISEYSGVVALCLGANYDRSEFWADPSELAGIGKAWRQRIAERFEREFGSLSKLGTMSNGGSVYQERG